MTRLGMVIDTTRCIGCEACTLACKAHNGTPPGIFLSRLLEKETGQYPHVRRVYLPVLCSHCKNPACVPACPSRALSKRPDGIVMLDRGRCCGVKACMVACPYEAIYFYQDKQGYFGNKLTPLEEFSYARHRPGTALKCDFCADRVDQGLLPACVEACPARTRTFGDLDNPDSEVSLLIRRRRALQLRPDAGADPSVYYLL